MAKNQLQRVLFLDIDGVLNVHKPALEDSGLETDKLLELARIVHVCGCSIVLSSAWRYMGFGKNSVFAQCVRGTLYEEKYRFQRNMILNAIIGCTPQEHCPEDRDITILRWLEQNKVDKWAALDDLECILRLPNAIRCLPNEGLTNQKANEVIELLLK